MTKPILFQIDLTNSQVKFTRPELLTHPNIPGHARGLNPRTIKGQEWWDWTRRKAYAENNYHCWACGGSDDPYKPELEAHECYDIDYGAGTLTFKEVVALCYSCHKFIHSGHLRMMVVNRRIPKAQAKDILTSRMAILDKNGLKPFFGTRAVYLNLVEGLPWTSALFQVRDEGLVPMGTPPPRHKWRLIIGDETYNYRGERIAEGTIT